MDRRRPVVRGRERLGARRADRLVLGQRLRQAVRDRHAGRGADRRSRWRRRPFHRTSSRCWRCSIRRASGPYPAVHQPWSQSLADSGVVERQPPVRRWRRRRPGRLRRRSRSEQRHPPFPADRWPGSWSRRPRGVRLQPEDRNIAFGGAVAGIIGMINDDPPFTGSLGACPDDLCSSIPGLHGQPGHGERADRARSAAAIVTVEVDPASGLPLVGSMVGSSSRGPTMQTNVVKPEIGAPGASVSAEAGTGTETTPFGGTSGAAPMVTGSAALLLSEFPDRVTGRDQVAADELRGDRDLQRRARCADQRPAGGDRPHRRRRGPGRRLVLRSRPGAHGTPRLRAARCPSASWMPTEDVVLTSEVTVRNYGGSAASRSTSRRPSASPTTEPIGAVAVSAPASVTVPADGDATFDVTVSIDAADAPRIGRSTRVATATTPLPLTELEYDGYTSTWAVRSTWRGMSCRASSGVASRLGRHRHDRRRVRGLPGRQRRRSTTPASGRRRSMATRSSGPARAPDGRSGPAASDDRPALRRRADDPGPGRLLLGRATRSSCSSRSTPGSGRPTRTPHRRSSGTSTPTGDGDADFAVFNLDLAGDLTRRPQRGLGRGPVDRATRRSSSSPITGRTAQHHADPVR